MTEQNTGIPAFPLSHSHKELEGTNWQHVNGMTLRDYFAAKAMQALIHVQVKTAQSQTTETAYEWADAMMEARNVAQ